MSFVDNVETPDRENCYSKQLALAIPPNVRNMKYFVTNLAASIGKNFCRLNKNLFTSL